ncbi:hypothetical protein PO909_028479 [Leuciscus waleckii]
MRSCVFIMMACVQIPPLLVIFTGERWVVMEVPSSNPGQISKKSTNGVIGGEVEWRGREGAGTRRSSSQDPGGTTGYPGKPAEKLST